MEVVRSAAAFDKERQYVTSHETRGDGVAASIEEANGSVGWVEAFGAEKSAEVALRVAKECREAAVGAAGDSQVEGELVVERDDVAREAVRAARGECERRGKPTARRDRGRLDPLPCNCAAPRVKAARERASYARQRE